MDCYFHVGNIHENCPNFGMLNSLFSRLQVFLFPKLFIHRHCPGMAPNRARSLKSSVLVSKSLLRSHFVEKTDRFDPCLPNHQIKAMRTGNSSKQYLLKAFFRGVDRLPGGDTSSSSPSSYPLDMLSHSHSSATDRSLQHEMKG